MSYGFNSLGPVEILRRYRQEKMQEELRGNWAITVLYRVPGAILTALALRVGLSAMTLTFAGAVVSIALPFSALVLPELAAVWGVLILGILFQVLDCADGDVARASGTTSVRGAQFDFVTDMAHWGLLYCSIGILADRFASGSGGLVALALIAAWMRLYARVLNDASKVIEGGSSENQAGGSLVVAFFSGLSGLIPFLALAAPTGLPVVSALLAYSLLDICDAGYRLMKSPAK